MATLSGSRLSFDLLVDRYRDMVFRLACFKVRDTHDAEDLAQDAFVTAYRSLEQLKEPGCFSAWLRKVAVNQCNMHLRRNHPSIIPLTDDMHPVNDPNQSMEQRLVYTEIMQALGNLSETNRMAAVLFFVDGFTQKEIAQFLDLPITTIKRRINLTRAQLRQEMLGVMKENIGQSKPHSDFSDKVSIKIDVIRWYHRFSECIAAGQSLVSILARLAEEDYHDTIRNETQAILDAIQSGMMVSDAMKELAPTLGTPMSIMVIRAGEIGGVLQHSASIITSWMEMEEMRARVDAAYWLRTFSFMLCAGVPLFTALETMKSVPAVESLADLTDTLMEAVDNGDFADGFKDYPVFGESIIALIRAGINSGLLEDAMELAVAEMVQDTYRQAVPASMRSPQASPKLIDALRSQISSPSPETRLGALKALEHIAAFPLSIQKPQIGHGSMDMAANIMSGENNLSSFISALTDPDTRIRKYAAQVLGNHQSPRAVTALVQAAEDSDASVRVHALLALFATDTDRAMEIAKSKLHDESADVRRAVVRVLAEKNGPEAVGLLIEMLDDSELLVAQPASEALIRTAESALEPLLESIQTRLPNIPDRHWETLQHISPNIARDTVLQALSSTDSDQPLHDLLLSKLARVATIEDAPTLIQALNELPYSLQWEIIRAIGRLKIREAIPGLIQWLDYPNPGLWSCVTNALAHIGDISCIPTTAAKLETILDKAEDVNLNTETITTISQFTGLISQFGSNNHAGLVLRAILTTKTNPEHLAPIATVNETKHMAKLLNTKDDQLSILSARFFRALADRGVAGKNLIMDAGAMPALKRAAKSEQVSVRKIAGGALGRLLEMG